MDNYEINILRRGGNWKKVKPNDLIIDEIDNELKKDDVLDYSKSDQDFLSYVTRVDAIISKLESLENEKNNLKEELKAIENEFLNKKKSAEDKIHKLSQEKEMFEKALKVIKNLKTF